jgi:hypothetical protein
LIFTRVRSRDPREKKRVQLELEKKASSFAQAEEVEKLRRRQKKGKKN